MKKTLALVAFAAASTTAFAQGTMQPEHQRQMYGELGYNMLNVEDDRLPGYSADIDAVTAIVGYRFHPNVSGEVILGTGLGTENVAYGDTIVSSKLNSTIGVFARPAMKINEQFELFGRLGLVHTRLDLAGGGAGDETGISTAYGVGVNWHFNQEMYGQVSYTSLYDRNNATVDGLTLGIGMDF